LRCFDPLILEKLLFVFGRGLFRSRKFLLEFSILRERWDYAEQGKYNKHQETCTGAERAGADLANGEREAPIHRMLLDLDVSSTKPTGYTHIPLASLLDKIAL